MATPNWDILHTRFATSVRDAVGSASAGGSELSVADRDTYLMYAYNQYVRLLSFYNPTQVQVILSELFAISQVNATTGVATLPIDFGYLLDVASATPGTVLQKIDPDKFQRYSISTTLQNPFTSIYIGYCLVGNTIKFLPSSLTDIFQVSYVVAPALITEGGSNDILIKSEHWDTILSLAKVQYYRDKQEFQIAEAFLKDAITNSPFPITSLA